MTVTRNNTGGSYWNNLHSAAKQNRAIVITGVESNRDVFSSDARKSSSHRYKQCLKQ